MPVTYDNSVISAQTSTASMTVALTIATNASLLVGISTINTADKSVSSVVANGVTMTQLGRFARGTEGTPTVAVFGLTAAPSGVVSISCNLLGAAALFEIIAVSYIGCKSTNPFGTINGGTLGGVANWAISLSTSTTDQVVFFASGWVYMHAENATNRQTGAFWYGSFWADTAGAANAISLSASGQDFNSVAWLGLNLAFSVSSITSPFTFNMLGVGA